MATIYDGVDIGQITPLTMQQVFDNALNGVIRQGCFSIRGQGCYYNHPMDSNVHCGIGHSIPPEWRVRDTRIVCLVAADLRVGALFKNVPEPLLVSIQYIHDAGARSRKGLAYFREQMKILAEQYGLTYTEPAT